MKAAELTERRAAHLHEHAQLTAHRLLLGVELRDPRPVAVEQPQPQRRRSVKAPAAIAASERRQPRPDRLAVGQLLAQLQRQPAQHRLGLVEQVLAAGEDRPALVVPQRQQLAQLVRAAVLPGALERPGQQRVRERLSRDPLGVQRVGLAALACAIGPRRAVRAHVAHVIATADEEHRRVAPPTRGALDPPAGDRPELACPCLKRTMPIARDPEMLAGNDPPRGSTTVADKCPLMRVDPDHVARVERASTTRSTDPDPFVCRPSVATSTGRFNGGAGRQCPGRDRRSARSTLLSGQTGSSKTRTEADTSETGHLPGSETQIESDPGPVFDPNASRRRREVVPAAVDLR